MDSDQLPCLVMNKAFAHVKQDSMELNALNAIIQPTMVLSAKKSVDAMNSDQLENPVIDKAYAHVEQDLKNLNARAQST